MSPGLGDSSSGNPDSVVGPWDSVSFTLVTLVGLASVVEFCIGVVDFCADVGSDVVVFLLGFGLGVVGFGFGFGFGFL